MWSIWPPTGDYELAALLHDYLYQTGMSNRKHSDRTFLRIMEWLDRQDGFDIPKRRRKLLYWGVRMGGWVAWNKYRK